MNGSASLGASKNYTDKKIAEMIIDFVYPVGSIYLSINKVSPETFMGGKWELIEEGRALWTTESNDGGELIDAGLPNIKGDLTLVGGGSSGGWFTANGAIKEKSSGNRRYWASSNGASAGVSSGFEIDASKSNEIYGKSDTVQPPAIKVYAFKRIS